MRPVAPAGAKGCSYPRIRECLRQQRIRTVIPQENDEVCGGRMAFGKDNHRR